MNNMSGKQILACKLPGDLFSAPENMENEFDRLAKKWHPDKPGGDVNVMATINVLAAEAKKMISAGKWESSSKRFLTLNDGQLVRVSFLRDREFELGQSYICNSVCVYIFKLEYAKAYEAPKFKFSGTRMKDEFTRYLPRIIDRYTTIGGERIVVIDRPSDLVCLRDLLEHFSGNIPPRHVAWILSSLYNLCCFFRYNKLIHNSVNLDTYFVSPGLHGGTLLGGWWYHTSPGKKMTIVPGITYSVMTTDAKKSKRAVYVTDLECVKMIGRTLLGSSSGSSLYKVDDLPKPMIQFLRSLSSDNAVDEYKEWTEVLSKSFGPKKFIEMGVDAKAIYNPSR